MLRWTGRATKCFKTAEIHEKRQQLRQEKTKCTSVCSSLLILFAQSSLHSPPSLFHIQPIITLADGSLTCSQHAPFPAHVSAVEWVTWADSRWCSLGGWAPVCLLSPLPAQSIIILLCSPLPQDHWRYSGPPSYVPSFTLRTRWGWGVGWGCQCAQPWAFYPGSARQLADVQFRQGTVGQLLMMWFSDKPGTTGWKSSLRHRTCTKAIRCVA